MDRERGEIGRKTDKRIKMDGWERSGLQERKKWMEMYEWVEGEQ